MSTQQLITRIVLLFSAFLLANVSAPVLVQAPVAIVSVGATAQLVANLRGGHLIDQLLSALGFVTVAGIIGGLVLNLLPPGLTAFTWAAYFLAIGGAVLAYAYIRFKASDRPRRTIVLQRIRPVVTRYVAAAALLCVAVSVSVIGDRTGTLAPLALSVHRQQLARVTLEVASGRAERGLVLSLTAQRGGKASWVSPTFAVGPDSSHFADVPLPRPGRWRIALLRVGHASNIRELVVES